MKKVILAVLALAMVLLAFQAPVQAHDRFGVFVGPGVFPYYAPYPYYPYQYYYPGYYPAPPVVVQQPPAMIQQRPPQPPAPAPQAQQQDDYWYYCRDPKGYYPYVKQCPAGWTKVPASTTPPDAGTPDDMTAAPDAPKSQRPGQPDSRMFPDAPPAFPGGPPPARQ